MAPELKILSVDIGGSNLKAALLDTAGNMLQAYVKYPTPRPATPANILAAIERLAGSFAVYDCIAVGFPGYVRDGVVKTAPNLDVSGEWENLDFRQMLEGQLGKPVKLINDADMQGLAIAAGKGLELLITLGTGFGTAMLQDGRLLPHLELAHHPVTRSRDYDRYIGGAEMDRIGVIRWNKRMKRVIAILKTVFNYDMLYIGGGNARALDLPGEKNIMIVSNKDGIKGGARLWAT